MCWGSSGSYRVLGELLRALVILGNLLRSWGTFVSWGTCQRLFSLKISKNAIIQDLQLNGLSVFYKTIMSRVTHPKISSITNSVIV